MNNLPTLQEIFELSMSEPGAINPNRMKESQQKFPMRGADGILFYVGDTVKCVSPNKRVNAYQSYVVYAVDHGDNGEGTDPVVQTDDGHYRMIFAHRFIKV